MGYSIRQATVKDAQALLDVYAPFVTDTCISFEYVIPTLADFAKRITDISAEYPYLVLELDGEIVGYAYAHRYLARAAYDWDAEMTTYLAPVAQGQGMGVIIEEAVEELLRLQNIKNLYGCITGANKRSVEMHMAMGYVMAGTFFNAGYKHGKWLDVVWLQKSLAACEQAPQNFIKFPDVEKEAVAKVLATANERLKK